jgi:cytochrome c
MKKLLELAKQQAEIVKSQAKEIAPAAGIAVGIALFVTIFANIFYQPKDVLKRGFQIELAADGKPVAQKVEQVVSLPELMKLADVSRGAKIFKKCASCHNVERGAAAKVGPNLFGIVGKKRASFPGFAYSDAMKAKGGAWDRTSIDEFITKPKNYIPGTKMAFAGLKKPQDRADVILFLEQNR